MNGWSFSKIKQWFQPKTIHVNVAVVLSVIFCMSKYRLVHELVGRPYPRAEKKGPDGKTICPCLPLKFGPNSLRIEFIHTQNGHFTLIEDDWSVSRELKFWTHDPYPSVTHKSSELPNCRIRLVAVSRRSGHWTVCRLDKFSIPNMGISRKNNRIPWWFRTGLAYLVWIYDITLN